MESRSGGLTACVVAVLSAMPYAGRGSVYQPYHGPGPGPKP